MIHHSEHLLCASKVRFLEFIYIQHRFFLNRLYLYPSGKKATAENKNFPLQRGLEWE